MLRFFRIVVLAAVISGCVSTQIQTDWKDPDFRGTFKKVMVICLAQDELVRTTLESYMAEQFTNRGVKAVPSNTVFPTLANVDRDMVRKKLSEMDADGVLLIRPVDKDIAEFASYDLWAAYNDIRVQPVAAEVYKVQVSLFEAAEGKVVWQALSDTIIGGVWMDTLKKFAKAMGDKLIERKLI